MISYNEQYEKIIAAYFKDEIRPYSAEFCFCGTLAGQAFWWNETLYTLQQYRDMEAALLISIRKHTLGFIGEPEFTYSHISDLVRNVKEVYGDGWIKAYHEKHWDLSRIKNHPNYENAIFEGMVAALEVLKQIHIDRGEKIDEPATKFEKRKLQTV